LRKAAISFVMPVPLSARPSVRMEQLCSHWTDFNNIWYLSIFGNSGGNIAVALKYDKNNGYFIEYQYTFLLYICQFFLEWDMFQAKAVETIQTHIWYSIFFSKIVPFMR